MIEESMVDMSSNNVQDSAQVDSNETADYEAYRASRNGKAQTAEPVAETEKATPAPVQAAKGQEEAESGDEEKRPSGYKRLKLENERLKAQLAGKSSDRAETPSDDATPTGKPLLKDYESADEWEEAKYEWRKSQEAEAERRDAHAKRMAKAKQAHGEAFDEAIAALDGVNAKEKAFDAIRDSDQSADILFYLGTHAEEAERFEKMSDVQQIKYIGRLEDKLADAGTAQQQETKPAAKAVKAPPPPIKPLTGGKTVGTSATDWMGADDYETYRAGRKQAARANQ